MCAHDETITDRIDSITLIPPAYLQAAPPAPRSVKIEISPRCNYRCGFCALRTREAQPKWDMDFGLFKRVTREMREAGVEELGMFYLGESFMNPRLLVDCIRWAKQTLGFPYVFLTSNASMAFPEAVEECMKAGLDSLKWSINAADEEQFEEVMGVSGKLFYRALDNVKAAWSTRRNGGYRTGLYASSIRYDGAQLEKMQALLAGHVLPFVDQHYWLPLYSMGAFAATAKPSWATGPRPATRAGSRRWRAPLPAGRPSPGARHAEGKLSACCFDADRQLDHGGDLNKLSFMEAWHSQPFVALRAAQLKKDVRGTVCEQCIATAAHEPAAKPVSFA